MAASWLEHLVYPGAIDRRSFFDKFDRGVGPLEQREAEVVGIEARPELDSVEIGMAVDQSRNSLGRRIGTWKCCSVMIGGDLRDGDSEPAKAGTVDVGEP